MTKITKGELTTTPFNIIHQSDILTNADLALLEPLKQELAETFKKSQVFRTRTEMEISVLNDIAHPTHASKYWQSTREQNVMFHELVMLSYEYRKNIVEIKKLQRELETTQDMLDNELIQIEIEKKMFVSKNQERVAQDRIRELKAWSEIKEREAQHMTEEELSDVNNHQLQSYVQRWLKQSKALDSASIDERNNLVGQLDSGLRELKKRGLSPETNG